MTLDSDKNIEVTGRITSIKRGKEACASYLKVDTEHWRLSSTIILSIQDSQSKMYNVDLPVVTYSDIDLIPWELGLLREEVRYKKGWDPWEEGVAKNWQLEVLTGKLKGNVYEHKIA